MSKIKEIIKNIYSKPRKYKRGRFYNIIKQYNNSTKNNFTIAEKIINLIKAEKYKNAFLKKREYKKHKEKYKKDQARRYKERRFKLYEGIYSTLEKQCNRCKETKSIFEFYKKWNPKNGRPQTNSKGRYSLCKTCRCEAVKLYAKKNPEKIKETNKRQHNKIYNRIGKRLRFKLWRAIRRWRLDKTELALRYVGMSVKDLVPYLESQFTEGMTWEKFMNGKIHIDHIIPFCSVDLTKEENRYLVSNYKNLRPIWDLENLSKSGEDRKKSIHSK